MKDLHLEAGLVSTKNEEGEVEYIGTRKEWQKFEDLEKKEPADDDEVREGEKIEYDDASESVLREEAKIASDFWNGMSEEESIEFSRNI